MKHEHPEHNRQRGFVSFGTEHAKDSNAADLKEFWQVGQTNIPAGADMDNYPPNAEVAERPHLAPQADELYQKLGACWAPNAQGDCPASRTGGSVLRTIRAWREQHPPLIHYPPITSEPDSSVRAGQHEDINLITLSGWSLRRRT